MRTRLAIAAPGVAAAAYGGWLLLDDALGDLVSVAVWFTGGVLLHDLVLAPVVLLAAWLGHRLLPVPARAPTTVGLVVLGTVSLVAVPVLGRFGASPGNDTLLDRNYWAGWLLLAGLTAVGVVVASLVRSGRGRHGVRAGR